MDLSNAESVSKLLLGLLIAVLVITAFNSLRISTMNGRMSVSPSSSPTSLAVARTSGSSGVLPTGIPPIYGQELGVSFDDVSTGNPQKADATIAKLGQLDQSITLSGKDKERYINILYKLENGISCEYCCGARAVIFENGEPACGCAHSYAMRGITKYLLVRHGSEYTDAQLLEEAGKWKVLFFPGIHEQKAEILKSQGIPVNFINLASNKYRGIEQGKSAGGAGGSAPAMVGGC